MRVPRDWTDLPCVWWRWCLAQSKYNHRRTLRTERVQRTRTTIANHNRVPSTRWCTDDELNTGWTKRANIGSVTPMRVHTAFHTDRLRAWNNATSGSCVSRGRRRLCGTPLGRNRNWFRDGQETGPRWTHCFSVGLFHVPNRFAM